MYRQGHDGPSVRYRTRPQRQPSPEEGPFDFEQDDMGYFSDSPMPWDSDNGHGGGHRQHHRHQHPARDFILFPEERERRTERPARTSHQPRHRNDRALVHQGAQDVVPHYDSSATRLIPSHRRSSRGDAARYEHHPRDREHRGDRGQVIDDDDYSPYYAAPGQRMSIHPAPCRQGEPRRGDPQQRPNALRPALKRGAAPPRAPVIPRLPTPNFDMDEYDGGSYAVEDDLAMERHDPRRCRDPFCACCPPSGDDPSLSKWRASRGKMDRQSMSAPF